MARFLFMDWETQSDADLPIVGTLNYVLDPSTRVLLKSWCVDQDGPVKLWVPDLRAELAPEVWAYILSRVDAWGPPPAEIVDLFAAEDPVYMVAWNAAFDRHTWQQVATPENGFPELRLEQTLDSMAAAQASNLPGQLDWAGRMLGLGQKTVGGKALMKRFAMRQEPLPGAKVLVDAVGHRAGAVQKAIEDWALYLDYGAQDTALMRSIWYVTRPLDAQEWAEYWASERINDRGMLADLDVCAGAVQYREEESTFVAEECLRLTGGVITRPTLTAQINAWLLEQLPDDLAQHIIKERNEETGEPTKLSGNKQALGRLLEDIYLSDNPPPDNVTEFVELLQFGRSSSAVKFEKILHQSVDGRLTNSYVFNGAGQTGRLSSRGVQIHNLPRDKVPNELDVLDMIAARVPIEDLRKLPLTKDDAKKNDRGPTSVNALLARLIRPTFHAPEGKLMVWGDWSAIEARVTPWLANTRDAERAVLDAFRNGDDLYLLNAESIFRTPYDVLRERYENGDPEAKGMRQAGKVAVLALGFLGGVGALRAMARGYGMRLSDAEAKLIVDGWRDRNRWARRFGDKCQESAFAAINKPGQMFEAGRVRYQYAPNLMGGTLICWLPDMRPIVYPRAKLVTVEKFDKPAKAISYLNGMGYRTLWNGLLVENCVSGVARVVTARGIVHLDEVQSDDLMWDGVDFVRHSKLVCKGLQPVITRWGVQMTPDHKVLTHDGWKEAKACTRSDRADVRFPDDAAPVGSIGGPREAVNLVGALRLRERTGSPDRRLSQQPETISEQLRMQDARTALSGGAQPWNVGSPGVLGMAVDDRPLHAANAPGVGQLRRPRHHRLRALAAVVLEFLGGHGRHLRDGADDRSREQQQGVLAGELPLGLLQSSGAQHAGQPDDRYPQGADAAGRGRGDQRDWRYDASLSAGAWMDDGGAFPTSVTGQQVEVVYDIVDCGPRNRFVVLDEDGVPFIVHNCTQATAASILRGTLVRLDEEEHEAETVGDTHDEIICEAPEASAEAFADRLEKTMVRGFDWSAGLPLAAEVEVDFYYHK